MEGNGGVTMMSQQANNPGTVRAAVTLATNAGVPPSMEIMERDVPLVNIVASLCRKWKLDDSDLYQLQFDDQKVSPPPIFITEQNRTKMKDGDILKLDFSPKQMSRIIIDGFQKGNLSEENATRMAKFSIDITFVEQFITANGFIELVKHIIAASKLSAHVNSKSKYALEAFVEIMDHSIMSWETLDTDFLHSIIWYIEEKNSPPGGSDIKVIKSALSILDSAILNCEKGRLLATEARLGVGSFIHHLRTRDVEVQILCISLINTILSVSPLEQQQKIRKQILSQPTRNVIWESVFTGPVSEDMAYHLHTLQTRLLNLLGDRLHGAIKPSDPAALKEVSDLRKIAFDDDSETGVGRSSPRRVNESRDFTKLGFRNSSEPLEEFKEAPPGALALDCMAFFAHQYTQHYRQVVLENSRERADEQDCPFAMASVKLTQLLAEILNIGVEPKDNSPQEDRTYYPMFFSKEKPFEECFCACIQRFTRTWKEMKASLADFNKVLMVVREQVTRALAEKPHTFDSLKTKLTNWSFAKIQDARQKELEDLEELKRQAKPIKEMREMIKPEILDIIKQQRINCMISGHSFKSRSKAKADKYIYCRLSHNAKVLQYNYTQEQTTPDTLRSVNVLDVQDVRESEDGKSKSKSIVVTIQGPEELHLNTDNQTDYEVWLDGLYALTGKEMRSKQALTELDQLLSMEVKLRLLDAEGIDFPNEPPPIPAAPTNFNFVTA